MQLLYTFILLTIFSCISFIPPFYFTYIKNHYSPFMAIVRVHTSKNNNKNGISNIIYLLDMQEGNTILDIKKKLSSNFSNIMLKNNGEVLHDNDVIVGDMNLIMENNDTEEFNMEFNIIDKAEPADNQEADLKEDINEELISKIENIEDCSNLIEKFNDNITYQNNDPIYTYSTINVNGESIRAKNTDIIFKDGRKYYVTNRIPRLTLKTLFNKLNEYLNDRALVVQLLMLLFIIQSGNIFLLSTIVGVRLLRMISSLFKKHELWRSVKSHTCKSLFMFVASLILLDHNSFYENK